MLNRSNLLLVRAFVGFWEDGVRRYIFIYLMKTGGCFIVVVMKTGGCFYDF